MYIITRLHKANEVSCIEERTCSIDPLHPPTRIHWDLIKAKQEAARLAEKHPGLQFMVFQATDAVMLNDVISGLLILKIIPRGMQEMRSRSYAVRLKQD